MKDDPAILRIREARHRISERFGRDTKKIVAHYIKLQSRHKDRLIGLPKRSTNKKKAAVT